MVAKQVVQNCESWVRHCIRAIRGFHPQACNTYIMLTRQFAGIQFADCWPFPGFLLTSCWPFIDSCHLLAMTDVHCWLTVVNVRF